MLTKTHIFPLQTPTQNTLAALNISRCPFHRLHEEVNSTLHFEEKKHLETLEYEKRIHSYLLGRFSAKKALSALLCETDLSKIVIRNGVFNQPLVETHHLGISLAHCDDFAVAIGFSPLIVLGIDIENHSSLNLQTIEKELTPREKKMASQETLSVFWTSKESLSKALKTGLTVPLSILEVESIEFRNGFYHTTFTHFFQYHSISWKMEEYTLSLTYPKNVLIDLEFLHDDRKNH